MRTVAELIQVNDVVSLLIGVPDGRGDLLLRLSDTVIAASLLEAIGDYKAVAFSEEGWQVAASMADAEPHRTRRPTAGFEPPD